MVELLISWFSKHLSTCFLQLTKRKRKWIIVMIDYNKSKYHGFPIIWPDVFFEWVKLYPWCLSIYVSRWTFWHQNYSIRFSFNFHCSLFRRYHILWKVYSSPALCMCVLHALCAPCFQAHTCINGSIQGWTLFSDNNWIQYRSPYLPLHLQFSRIWRPRAHEARKASSW